MTEQGPDFREINIVPYISDFIPREKTKAFLLEQIQQQEVRGEIPLVHIGGLPGTGKSTFAGHFAKEIGKPIWIGVGQGAYYDQKSILGEIGIILKEFYHKPEFYRHFSQNIANEIPNEIRTITYGTLTRCLNQDNYILCIDNFNLIEHQVEVIDLITSIVRITNSNRKTKKSKLKAVILISENKPVFERTIDIQLEGFGSISQTEKFLKNRMGSDAIKKEQIGILHEKTEGHPGIIDLFILFLKMLPPQNVGKTLNDLMNVLEDIHEITKVKDFILNRIDHKLNVSQKFVLEVVSLLRQPFRLKDAREILNFLNNDDNIEDLMLLRKFYFIRQASEPDYGSGYYHMHKLLRDYFAKLLPSTKINTIHDKAALHFINQEDYFKAGEHYIKGNNLENAARILIKPDNRDKIYARGNIGLYYELLNTFKDKDFRNQQELLRAIYTRKGDALEVMSDYSNALNCYLNALEFCREKEGLCRVELLRKLGWVYQRLSKWDDSIDMYQQGLDITASHQSHKLSTDFQLEEGRIRVQLGFVYFKKLEFPTAIDNCNKGITLLVNSQEEERSLSSIKIQRYLAQGHLFLGLIHHGEGKYELALEYFEKAMNLYKDIEDDYGVCQTNLYLGMALGSLDRNFSRASFYLEQAYQDSKNLSFSKIEGDYFRQKAKIRLSLGEFEEAIEDMKSSIAIQERIEAHHDLAWSHNTLGNIYFSIGELIKAEEKWNKAKLLFENNNSTNDLIGIKANLAVLKKLRGDFQSARADWEDGLKHVKRVGDQDWEITFLINLIELDLFTEVNTKRVKEEINECKKRTASPGFENFKSRVLYLNALYHLEGGRIEKSLETIDECCSQLYIDYFENYYLALLLRVELFVLLGQIERAQKALDKALQYLGKRAQLRMIAGRIERARSLILTKKDHKASLLVANKSIELFSEIGAPLLAAGTQYKVGRALKRGEEGMGGNLYLKEALSFFQISKAKARVNSILKILEGG